MEYLKNYYINQRNYSKSTRTVFCLLFIIILLWILSNQLIGRWLYWILGIDLYNIELAISTLTTCNNAKPLYKSN